jgi:hypothetical protein
VDAFRDRQADVADVNSGLHGAGGISHEGTTGIEADELTCLAAALKWYGGADRAHGYGVPRSDGVVPLATFRSAPARNTAYCKVFLWPRTGCQRVTSHNRTVSSSPADTTWRLSGQKATLSTAPS